MPLLLNNITGKTELIQEADAPSKIRSGAYGFTDPSQKVAVRNPEGKLAYLKAGSIKSALNEGYKLATQQEAADAEERRRYAGAGGAVIAGAAGAISGLGTELATAGVTKALETALPGSERLIQKSREANPGAEILANVAATVGASALTGGTGTAAKLIAKTPMGLVTKAGEKAALAFEKSKAGLTAAGMIGKTTTATAGKMAAKALSKAAGSAVEGVLYSSGQVAGEEILGDHEHTAQSAIATIGLGGILGGAIGGALGVAEGGSKYLAESTLKGHGIKDKIKNLLSEFSDDRVLKAGIGQNKRAFQEIAGKDIGKDLAETLRKEGIVSVKSSTPEKIAENINAYQTAKEAELNGIVAALDDATINNPASRIRASEVADRIEAIANSKYSKSPAYESEYKFMMGEAEKIRAMAPETSASKSLMRKTDPLTGAPVEQSAPIAQKSMSYAEAREQRAAYQKLVNWRVDANEMKEAKRSISRVFNDMMDEKAEPVLKTLGATKTWRDVRHEYARMEELREYVEKKVAANISNRIISPSDYGVGLGTMVAAAKEGADASKFMGFESVPVIGPIAAAVGHKVLRERGSAWAGIAADKFAKMRFLEKANDSTTKAITGAIDSFFEKASTLAKRSSQPIASSVVSNLENMYSDKNKDIRDQWNSLSSNPSQIASAPIRFTGAISGAAPNTSSAMAATAANAITYLKSKQPLTTATGGPLEAVRESKPSSIEVAKWKRYVRAVVSPMSVLDDMKNGNITKEGVDALKNVYPKLYNKITQEMLLRVSDSKKPLTKSQRKQIGALFGAPSDNTQRASLTRRIQSMHAGAMKQEAQKQQMASLKSGLSMAKNSKTSTQRLQERL